MILALLSRPIRALLTLVHSWIVLNHRQSRYVERSQVVIVRENGVKDAELFRLESSFILTRTHNTDILSINPPLSRVRSNLEPWK
ncbi:hypothetical protein FOXYSP1_11099 [Fusarium oxysporum f. sp. phaseoli]